NDNGRVLRPLSFHYQHRCRSMSLRAQTWARWFGDGQAAVEVNLETLFQNRYFTSSHTIRC
ncbi:hypothetical protein KIP42_20890, partial [Xanthomonas campestris pv. campestris]